MSDDVTHADFVLLVAAMRAKQVEYFRSRSLAVLEESKALERRVDEAVRRLRGERTQQDMFSAGGE